MQITHQAGASHGGEKNEFQSAEWSIDTHVQMQTENNLTIKKENISNGDAAENVIAPLQCPQLSLIIAFILF